MDFHFLLLCDVGCESSELERSENSVDILIIIIVYFYKDVKLIFNACQKLYTPFNYSLKKMHFNQVEEVIALPKKYFSVSP